MASEAMDVVEQEQQPGPAPAAMDIEPGPPPPPPGDVNDYSRFDAISDSDSDDEKKTAATEEVPLLTYSECMQQAGSRKDEGNAAFKAGNTADALVHYISGIDKLKSHATVVSAIPETKVEADKLLTTLHGNASMCYLKQEDYNHTIESCTAALAIESANVKALYRRGLSYSKTSFFAEGKADLQKCLELEPTNAAAKVALQELAKLQKAFEDKEKKSFSKMFGGPSMYADRERELQVKQRRAAGREELIQDEYSKFKLERRKTRADETEQTFDEFKVEYEKKEKEKKEEEEKARKAKANEEVSNNTRPFREAKPAAKKDDSDDDEEEDLGLVRGYKTTSDGRKTTFFNKELDVETKALIGDIAPKAISAPALTTASPAPAAAAATPSGASPAPADSGSVAASSWNKAGTWEERDLSTFVTDRLKTICGSAECETRATEPTPLVLKASVRSVKKAEGDAQIILARGKKRHVYDFALTVEFEINVDSDSVGSETSEGGAISKKIKGTIEFHDLSPESSTTGFDSQVKFAKALPSGLGGCIEKSAEALRVAVTDRLTQFESEFKAM